RREQWRTARGRMPESGVFQNAMVDSPGAGTEARLDKGNTEPIDRPRPTALRDVRRAYAGRSDNVQLREASAGAAADGSRSQSITSPARRRSAADRDLRDAIGRSADWLWFGSSPMSGGSGANGEAGLVTPHGRGTVDRNPGTAARPMGLLPDGESAPDE